MKPYHAMSHQEIVQLLKQLSGLDYAKRLDLENALGDTPFYAGLISFSEHPIDDAIEAYHWMLREWRLDPVMRNYSQQLAAALAHANAMLALLQREYTSLVD